MQLAGQTSADQKCFEIPGTEDEGLDMEVEFTDSDRRGTGKRVYLQLKAATRIFSDGSAMEACCQSYLRSACVVPARPAREARLDGARLLRRIFI
jgi:hypothetical protein